MSLKATTVAFFQAVLGWRNGNAQVWNHPFSARASQKA